MNLEYRGEGSAAMVFALPKENEVLRLIKSETVRKIHKGYGDENKDEVNLKGIQMAVREQLENIMDYVRNVMQPLFSNQFVVVPTLTEVPHGFVHKALAVTKHERPVHRKKLSGNSLDADIQWAFVLPDCCFVRHHNTSRDPLISNGVSDDFATKDSSCVKTFSNKFCQSGDTAYGFISEELKNITEFPHCQGMKPESLCTGTLHNGHNNSLELRPDISSCTSDSFSCRQNIRASNLDNAKNSCDETNSDAIAYESERAACKGLDKDVTASNLSTDEEVSPGTECLHSNNDVKDFTLSFEIKPKKSFMTPRSTGEGGQPQVCKFCMHQCLKFKDGKFSEISGYCPLDFFSGDRTRMKHALVGLIKAPQHQLKICKDGKEVYGSEIRQDLSDILKDWFPQHGCSSEDLLSDFLELVLETLLHSPNASNPTDTQSNGCGNCETRQESKVQNHTDLCRDPVSRVDTELARLTEWSRKGQGQVQICGNSPFYNSTTIERKQILRQGSVLGHMSQLQKIDQLDIEDVYLAHSALVTKMDADPDLRKKWRWDGPYTNISWILGVNYGLDQDTELGRDSLEDNMLKVKRFLVSKTLQDCSIIVAIKPVRTRQGNQGNENCIQFRGAMYDFGISIIDLDPKSVDKVPFYYNQAVDIVSAFRDLTS